MESLLFEDPWIIGLLGLLSGAGALLLWTQTMHRAALGTGVSLLMLTVVAVAINLVVRTDREQIRDRLREVAEALERNDHKTVLAAIHPAAVEVRRRAEAELPRYDFSFAKITGIRSIEVNERTDPKAAEAEFFVRVHLSSGGQVFRVARFIRLYLSHKDGRWLVRDYEHFDPSVGMRRTGG
ncbi:MAG: hypothetical protein KatS3mg111_2154 [Pirellulaceae bacterium]|nr:MAG: hypothetical protein KatS3mg111_2154 [Pirellulaceae bacterium]